MINPRFIEYVLVEGAQSLLPQNLQEPWWSCLSEQRESFMGENETAKLEEFLLAVHCLASPGRVQSAHEHIKRTGEGTISLSKLFQLPSSFKDFSQDDFAEKMQCYSIALMFEDLRRKGAIDLHDMPTLEDVLDVGKNRSFTLTESGKEVFESLFELEDSVVLH